MFNKFGVCTNLFVIIICREIESKKKHTDAHEHTQGNCAEEVKRSKGFTFSTNCKSVT